MKTIRKIIYICSIVLPILDAISGTIKGLKKGLISCGNEQLDKEQEDRFNLSN